MMKCTGQSIRKFAVGEFRLLTNENNRDFLLVCIPAIASHWSTALVETSSLVLLIFFGLKFPVRRKALMSLIRDHSPDSKLLKMTLILWGIYIIAIILSLAGTDTLFSTHSGLVLHPLLFLVALVTPMAEGRLVHIGRLFLFSGLIAAVATFGVNLAQGFPSPRFVFTGLTTFADLLCLAAIVALALQLRSLTLGVKEVVFGFFALLAAGGIFWTAEFTPMWIVVLAGGLLIASFRPGALLAWSSLSLSALFLVPSNLREKAEWLLQGGPLDRYVVWSEGYKNLVHVPLFGYGPASYEHVLPQEAWGRFLNKPPASWHNDLLQTWFDSGPIAATALLGLFVAGAAIAIALGFRSQTAPGRGVRLTTGLLLLCFFSFGLVGSVVTTAVLGVVWWILLGVTVQLWLGSRGYDRAREYDDR